MLSKFNIHSKSWPFFALYCIGALLCNSFLTISIYGNLTFHFGGILVILCLFHFGLTAATLPLLLATSALWYNLDNPFFFITLGLELVFIHVAIRRGSFALIADIGYWILIGMPLTLLILYLDSPDIVSTSFVLIIKQAINGILYVAIATIIAPFIPDMPRTQRADKRLPKMSTKVFEYFSTITILAAIITGIGLVELSARNAQQQLIEGLKDKSLQANAIMTNYIQSHRQKIEQLAEILSLKLLDESLLVEALNNTQANYSSFLTMLVADENGNIIAGAPENFYSKLKDAPLQEQNVADREYFSLPRRSGDSYVSQAFQGRGFGNDIIVAVSAPIYRDRQFSGIIEGSLNLAYFYEVESDIGVDEYQYIILTDNNGNIVYASPNLDLKVFDYFEYENSVGGESLRSDILSLAIKTQRESFFYQKLGTINDWNIYVLHSERSINQIIEIYYRFLLFVLIGIFVLSFFLSRLLSKYLTRPLEVMIKSMLLDKKTNHDIELVSFTLETQTLYERLESTKKVYLDFQNELKSQVRKRTQSLSRANMQLEQLTREDSLTGLLNRRAFDHELEKDLNKSQRHATPMCIALIDIDHFKQINDQYGHPVGDQFIIRVAEIVQESMQRITDVLARVGGEEFAVVFHAQSPTDSKKLLESCRQKIEASHIIIGDKKLSVTVSLGAIFLVPSKYQSASQLYSKADEQLYKSKQSGRNKLSFIDLVQKEE